MKTKFLSLIPVFCGVMSQTVLADSIPSTRLIEIQPSMDSDSSQTVSLHREIGHDLTDTRLVTDTCYRSEPRGTTAVCQPQLVRTCGTLTGCYYITIQNCTTQPSSVAVPYRCNKTEKYTIGHQIDQVVDADVKINVLRAEKGLDTADLRLIASIDAYGQVILTKEYSDENNNDLVVLARRRIIRQDVNKPASDVKKIEAEFDVRLLAKTKVLTAFKKAITNLSLNRKELQFDLPEVTEGINLFDIGLEVIALNLSKDRFFLAGDQSLGTYANDRSIYYSLNIEDRRLQRVGDSSSMKISFMDLFDFNPKEIQNGTKYRIELMLRAHLISWNQAVGENWVFLPGNEFLHDFYYLKNWGIKTSVTLQPSVE